MAADARPEPSNVVTGDLDRSGADELIVDFGPEVALWSLYDDSAWRRLHALSPVSMTCGDLDGL